jgi:type II secretory pathway pseudopilin PulG
MTVRRNIGCKNQSASGVKARAGFAGFKYGLKPVPFYQSGTGETRAPRRAGACEEGYILLAVVFLTVAVLIALAVAAPKVAADIQRDREVEMVHRGQQYVRAIKMYYKKFGAYPPTIDALVKSNDIRFLRKRYKDPMTGKDDWHLIHFGENKTPSYGFFGQPIGGAGGSTLAGVGPQGATGSGGLFSGNGTSGSGSSGSIFGSSDPNSQSGTQTTPLAGATSGTDPNAGANGANGTAGGTNSGGGLFSNSGFGSSSNSSPLTIGGLGIIGVESTNPKLGILEWKKKKHYNEWEFWYDPNADRMMISNNTGAIGQPAAGTSGFGNTSGGIGSPGSTPGGISNQPAQPSQPVQPTQPQQ